MLAVCFLWITVCTCAVQINQGLCNLTYTCDSTPIQPLELVVRDAVSVRIFVSRANGSHSPNIQCEWKLKPRFGRFFNIVVQKFDITESPDCTLDYMEVFYGNNPSGQSLGRWCGKSSAVDIDLHEAYIVYKSKTGFSGAGIELIIRAQYDTLPIFKNLSVSSTPQYLYSPNYGNFGVHTSLRHSEWLLTAVDQSKIIQVEIRGLYTGSSCSYKLQIYDGGSESNRTSLGYFCGLARQVQVVRSTGPKLLLVTRNSIFTFQYVSFSVLFSSRNKYSIKCEPSNQNDTALETITAMTTPTYLIVPRGSNSLWSTKIFCHWRITSNDPSRIIVAEMIEHNPDPNYPCVSTRLTIYDGNSTADPYLVSSCGTKTPFRKVFSSGTNILVHSTMYNNRYTIGTTFILKVFTRNRCESGFRRFIAYPNSSYAVLQYTQNSNDSNRHCPWIIEASEGRESVIVKVPSLGVLSSPDRSFSCLPDETYVLAYDGIEESRGVVTEGRHIPQTCKWVQEEGFRSSGKYMLLNVVTEKAMPRQEIKLEFYSRFGRCNPDDIINLEATMDEQTIFSPNFPDSYWMNEHCQWKIQSRHPGYPLSFRVVNARLNGSSLCENTDDRITVNDSSGTMLLQYCGGVHLPTDWIQSRENYVIIDFRSHFGNGGQFQLLYRFDRSDSSCDTSLNASGSYTNLSSLGYPFGLKADLHCWWTIQSTGAGYNVIIEFLDSHLLYNSGCNTEFVKVFDGQYSTDRMLGKWCNNQRPSYRSSGQWMRLHFKTSSDNGGSNLEKRFLLRYNSVLGRFTQCGGLRTAYPVADYINSPYYPKNYPDNADCVWTIKASTYYRVKIDFIDSKMDDTCAFVSVTVYDGDSENSETMIVFCSESQPTLMSSSRYMMIRFRSDQYHANRGFRLKYYQTTARPSGEVCNKVLYASVSAVSPRYLESPGYPDKYPSNLNCWWRISSTDVTSRVALEVQTSNLESNGSCLNDYVAVYDGVNEYATKLGQFCGNWTPSFASTGSMMFIVFHTDMNYNYDGFKLEYRSTGRTPAHNAYCTSGQISELLASDSTANYIESPNYPNTYPHDIKCDWRLISYDSRFIIKLRVQKSDVEESNGCKFDHLEAYDGYSTASGIIKRWCGRSEPTLYSTGGLMFVSFRSGSRRNFPGFRIEYKAVFPSEGKAESSSSIAATIVGAIIGIAVLLILGALVGCTVVKQRRSRQQHGNRSHQRSVPSAPSSTGNNSVLERPPADYLVASVTEAVLPLPNSLMVTDYSYGLPIEDPPPYPATEFEVKGPDVSDCSRGSGEFPRQQTHETTWTENRDYGTYL